jgi:LysR family transcriptional regulator, transcription activator of glutamate synthase operon
MDILQLKYFKKIAELENVSKASEELLVAQPALSKVVKQLETELDVKLFDRIGKRIILNENGRILLDHASAILNHMDDAASEINDLNHKILGSVTISMQAATRLLPKILLGFKMLHPTVKIIVKKQDDDSPICENSDLHIYSSRSPIIQDNNIVLLEEDCFIAMSKNHRLAGNSYVDMIDLKDEDFIILQEKKCLSDIIHESCREAGFIPNIVLECDNRPAIFALIENNMGIALIPSKTWSADTDTDIVFRKIRNRSYTRFINMAWKNNGYFSNLAALFRDYLVEFFKEL